MGLMDDFKDKAMDAVEDVKDKAEDAAENAGVPESITDKVSDLADGVLKDKLD